MENITKLRKELLNIDYLLKNLDKALDSAQPNLPGKIRIYFFYSHGYKRPPEPTLVQRPKIAKGTNPEKLKPIKISEKNLPKRALSKGQFSRNHNQTVLLLTLVSELLAYRKKITKSINDAEKIFSGLLKGNQSKLQQAAVLIKDVDAQVKENLTNAGLMNYYKELDNLTINSQSNDYDDTAF